MLSPSATNERGYDRNPDRSRHNRHADAERSASSSTRRHHMIPRSKSRSRSRSASPRHTNSIQTNQYSNYDNPFNDHELDSKFKWHKKRLKEAKEGLSAKEAKRRDRERRSETQMELERLNRQRAERERLAEERKREQERLQMDAETAQVSEWIAKEDEFYLEQAKRRAEIRLKNGRARSIDVLSITLCLYDGGQNGADIDDAGLEVALEEPFTVVENLSIEEINQLQEGIQMYISLEMKESNREFWRAMQVVCKDKLDKMQSIRTTGTGMDPVLDEIEMMLSTKTLDELEKLEMRVQEKLSSDEPLDVDYWEQLLKSLIVWKAKSKLRDIHEVVLRNRLEQLKKLQSLEANKTNLEVQNAIAKEKVKTLQQEENEKAEALLRKRENEKGSEDEERRREVMEQYIVRMNPMEKKKEEEDNKIQREEKVENRLGKSQFVEKEITLFEEEAAHDDSSDDEEISNIQAELRKESYLYEDKYRPRKPRYFNRVLTGYEWNSYNKTHYDSANPPPKSVQGYKFNIFYPDLIDKSKAPRYEILNIEREEDVVMIKFIAGPPYEDIAFRIVKKDWEFSHKKGFRCRFDRGILQLHVFFKRTYYRK